MQVCIYDPPFTRTAVPNCSIWTGWVPVDSCGNKGDLATSAFTVSNLRIRGTVVQGPTPKTCTGPPSPPLPPSPPPPPSPPSPPGCTDPNDGKTSDGTPCTKQKQWNNCGAEWMKGWCCRTCFNCRSGCGEAGPTKDHLRPEWRKLVNASVLA